MKPKLVINLQKILLFGSLMLAGSCTKQEVEFRDCVGGIDVDRFLFLGIENSSEISYVKDNKTVPLVGWADLMFNSDQSFRLRILAQCDSATSTPPFCELSDYANGNKTLTMTGVWDFEQEIYVETFSCVSGLCKKNMLNGTCTITILDSPLKHLEGDVFTMAYGVSCNSPYSRTVHRLGLNLPCNEDEFLWIRF